MPHYNIVFIGAGNVATQLGLALKTAGHSILQVYSKHLPSALQLAEKLKCASTTSLDKILPNADIYIISVKDDAIANVAAHLKLNNKMVVHTSGSISMNSLEDCSKNYGVFYPLQTFSKSKKADFKNVPICLEAANKYTFNTIEILAKSISNNIHKISSEQRIKIHIAAVFACNFSNHFYAIANDILKSNHLSLDLLKPLIAETAEKIKNNSPKEMQTGPAIRGDKKTMNKHLKIITNKTHQQLYKLISKSINDLSSE
jgi:predicted short-subunit dehydrogenase-like oxidoreductase (DUF2520 family)